MGFRAIVGCGVALLCCQQLAFAAEDARPPAADDIRKALAIHGAGHASGFYEKVLGHPLYVRSMHFPGDKWDAFLRDIPLLFGQRARDNATSGIVTVMLVRPLMKKPLDANDPVTLEAGARGLYDRYWTALGQGLNELPQPALDRIYLRLGHEMTGSWFAWGTSRKGERAPDPKLSADFAEYWRRIHRLIHAQTDGKHVRFDFNYSGNFPVENAKACYPGDEFVDAITLDAYASGASWGNREKVDCAKFRAYALDPLLAWGKAAGKPVGIDETSVVSRAAKLQPRGKQTEPRDPQQDGAAASQAADDCAEWFETIADWMEDARAQGLLSHAILFDVDNEKGNWSVLFRDAANPDAVIPGREQWRYLGADGQQYPTNNPKSAAVLVRRFGGPLVAPSPPPAPR